MTDWSPICSGWSAGRAIRWRIDILRHQLGTRSTPWLAKHIDRLGAALGHRRSQTGTPKMRLSSRALAPLPRHILRLLTVI